MGSDNTSEAVLVTFFFTVEMKLHNQGRLKETQLYWGLTVSEGESMTTVIRLMAARELLVSAHILKDHPSQGRERANWEWSRLLKPQRLPLVTHFL